MKLGVQVGLGPGDFVLDGDPAPSSWLRGPAVEHWSLADVLSLPALDL